MESSKTDSYGEWVIRKLQQEAGGNAHSFPAEVLAAARVVWPRIPAFVASEIKPQRSIREAEALAEEIWEEVLRSVGRAIGRNGNYGRPFGTRRLIFSSLSSTDFADSRKQNMGAAIGFPRPPRASISA